MQVILEDFKPLDKSAIWRLHDAYFAQKGISAWQDGEVPSYSTSNYQAALAHADFFLKTLARGPRAKDRGPIWIVEVGSGHGAFAVNFLRALDAHPFGRRFASRVRYLLTDYHARGLDEACALPALRPLVEAGRLVPALFDLRAPKTLTLRDGTPGPAQVELVIANYVTCVLPLKNLQKCPEGWFDQLVSLVAIVEGDPGPESPSERLERFIADATRAEIVGKELRLQFDWEACKLKRLYPKGPHAKVLERVTDAHDEATVGYPHGFIDFLRGFRDRLGDTGYVLVNDYGSVAAEEFAGLEERRPEFYGNSMANSVNFAIFDAVAEVDRWSLLRTRAPEELLHSAVLRAGAAWSEGDAQDFEAVYVASRGCDDVLDFWLAAQKCADEQDYDASLRFWARLLRLEPDNVEHYYRAGEVAIEADRYELAVALLERGAELAVLDARFDVDFQLGRAYCLLGRNAEAIAAYQRSLALDPHPVTFTNLGVLLEEEGEYRRAFRSLRAALGADPDNVRARERLEALRDRLWRQTLESWEGPDVVDPLEAPEGPASSEEAGELEDADLSGVAGAKGDEAADGT